MFNLRFDLRTPPFVDVTHGQQYREMLEMCRWGDTRGFTTAIVSEHHGTEDGFMCAPLAVSAAILAATENMMCSISALLVPYHDPIRLAEDIATIDNMAPGRLIIIAGLGYRESEFEMFGKDRTRRGRDTEAAIELMQQAWKGEPVEIDGRTVFVLPRPVTQPHPTIMVGGSVEASAKRAARLRLPYMPPIGDQALVDLYYAEAKASGFEGAFAVAPDGPGLVLVTEDPDALWARIGANLLYDAKAYASWQYPDQRSGWHVEAEDVAELKASGQYEIVTPEGCVDLVKRYGSATLHPMCGGIDPAIGWESLHLVVDKVIPALG